MDIEETSGANTYHLNPISNLAEDVQTANTAVSDPHIDHSHHLHPLKADSPAATSPHKVFPQPQEVS